MDLASSHSSDKDTMTYMEEDEVNSDNYSDHESEREKGELFSRFKSPGMNHKPFYHRIPESSSQESGLHRIQMNSNMMFHRRFVIGSRG